jgi:hypothetical protein
MEPVKPLFGTRTFAGRWGPYILFAAGYYVLPPGRPRNLYLSSALAIIGGFFVLDFHETQPEEPTWLNASPTIWSYLLWALGAWLTFSLIVEVRSLLRLARQHGAGRPRQQG